MPRPRVKNRTAENSRVLAVRISKELFEDFVLACKKNNLDKASVIEDLILDWLLHNIDRKTFKLKRRDGVAPGGGSEVVSPMGHSQGVNAVSEGVNKCPVCGGELWKVSKDYFLCSNCYRRYVLENGRLREV